MTSPAEQPWPADAGRRFDADPETVEKGLVQLVLTLVELLRQLMERQAIRRVEAGGLSDDDVERLGRTLMLLEDRMDELREHFGLEPEDLNIDLGPLGRLL
jgi:hypothetical protein